SPSTSSSNSSRVGLNHSTQASPIKASSNKSQISKRFIHAMAHIGTKPTLGKVQSSQMHPLLMGHVRSKDNASTTSESPHRFQFADLIQRKQLFARRKTCALKSQLQICSQLKYRFHSGRKDIQRIAIWCRQPNLFSK